MKKQKLIFVPLALSMLLAGCDHPTSSSSSGIKSEESSSSVSSSSSSYVDQYANKWSDADKTLLKKYCGSVLPYPEGKMTGKITLSEKEDSNGNKYLEITDESSSFDTMEDYYELLLLTGWNAITQYRDTIVQDDSEGLTYVECTKNSSDGKVGYDLIYYYVSATTDDQGEKVSGYNIIRCYNDASSTTVTDTAWSEEETATIKNGITITLPFIKLGLQHGVSTSDDGNTLALLDMYTGNLCSEYAELLVKDGFKKDTINSKIHNSYCLSKTLADGASISATLYYLNGNCFYFKYTPNITSHTSWPKAITDEIKTKSGVSIPEFPIDEGGEYRTYVKNNLYHIEGDTSDDMVKYNYDDAISELGLTQSIYSWAYTNWEETVSVVYDSATDDNFNTIGFGINIEITEPTSSFSVSWPTEAVSSALKDVLKIDGITLPSLPDDFIANKDKKIKYEIRGDEYKQARAEYYYSDIKEYPSFYDLSDDATDEEMKALALKLAEAECGLYISIYDTDSKAWEGYTKALEDAAFYVYYDEYSNNVYEDKDGKVGVTLSSYSSVETGNGLTTILIHKGSGNEHTPFLSFNEEDVDVAIGNTTQLSLSKNMLPYNVTYSSSDTTGKITVDNKGVVTVAEDVAEGTTAIITAKVTASDGEVYSATCTVKAKKIVTYTKASVIDAVASLLRAKNIEPTVTHSTDEEVYIKDYLEVSFDKSLGNDYVQSLVKNDLIPEGFEIKGDWKEADIYVGESEFPGYILDYAFEDSRTGKEVYLMFQYYESGDKFFFKAYATQSED